MEQTIQEMAAKRRHMVFKDGRRGLDAIVGLDCLLQAGELEKCLIDPAILVEAHGGKGPWVLYSSNLTEQEMIIYQGIGAIADHPGEKQVRELLDVAGAEKSTEQIIACLLKGENMEVAEALAALTLSWDFPEPTHEIDGVLVYTGHPYPFLTGLQRLDAAGNAPVQFNCKADGVTYSAMGHPGYAEEQEKHFASIWAGEWEMPVNYPGFKKILGMSKEELLKRLNALS